MKLDKLPKPVLDPARRSKIEVDEDHGLWGFFSSTRTSLSTPVELNMHGRGWTVPELRIKDWDDLHRLWWTCTKERNKLATQRSEIERVKRAYKTELYGDHEIGIRMKEVEATMKSIRFVLTERYYAWENARAAAMDDPEVDLTADPEHGEQAYLVKQDVDEVR